jgi:hypothetical protein
MACRVHDRAGGLLTRWMARNFQRVGDVRVEVAGGWWVRRLLDKAAGPARTEVVTVAPYGVLEGRRAYSRFVSGSRCPVGKSIPHRPPLARRG